MGIFFPQFVEIINENDGSVKVDNKFSQNYEHCDLIPQKLKEYSDAFGAAIERFELKQAIDLFYKIKNFKLEEN